MLNSVRPPQRTHADVPLTALNCIVVFSATKVDKMVLAPAATLMPPRHSFRMVRSPTAASLTFYAYEYRMGRVELLLAACSEVEGDNNHERHTSCFSIGCSVQVLGSLLFSCIMVGNKMPVATNIIRLRNRKAELETVLSHMRTRTTDASRELLPIRPAHEADATISEV